MEIFDSTNPTPTQVSKPKPIRRPLIRLEKIGPAFWTVSSIISMIVNIFLIAVVIILAQQLFSIKQVLTSQLIGGLYQNLY